MSNKDRNNAMGMSNTRHRGQRRQGLASKVLSVLLAFAMVATETPVTAIADEFDAASAPEIAVVPTDDAATDPAQAEPVEGEKDAEPAADAADQGADTTAGQTVTFELPTDEAQPLDEAMIAESKAADDNAAKQVTVELQFQDNNGKPAEPQGSAQGKTFYAYVAGKNQWGNAERIVTVPLTKVDGATGLYRATADSFYDGSGNTNNGAMYGVEDNLSYSATVYAPKNAGAPNANDRYDQNNKYNVVPGDQKAFDRYDVTVSTATAGGTATVIAKDTKKTFAPATVDTDYKTILGNAVNFGIVTENFDGAEAETNVAAITASQSAQSGNDLTNHEEQTFMFAHMTTRFLIKGESAYVLVPKDDADKPYHQDRNKLLIDTSETAEQITARVNEMLSHGSSQSATFAAHEPNAEIDFNTSSQKYELNLADKGAGTYYVEINEELYPKVMQNGAFFINKRADQVIVFNVTASNATVNNLGVQQFMVNNTASAGLPGVTGDVNARTLVWNFPNTTGTINTSGGTVGIFLAPSATIQTVATSGGWIIAKNVKIGSGEWHFTHDGVVKVFEHDDKTSFSAAKTIDGKTAKASGFGFKLERLTAGALTDASATYETVKEVTTDGASPSAVDFGDVTFTKDDLKGDDITGYAYFRITESQGAKDSDGNDYIKDSTVYYARVSLKKLIHPLNETDTEIIMAVEKPEYFSDASLTKQVVGLPTFDNKSEGTQEELEGDLVLHATKAVDNGGNRAGFEFVVRDSDGAEVARATSDSEGNVTFPAIHYREDTVGKTFTYTVSEVVPEGTKVGDRTMADGYLYDGTVYTVKVSVAKGDGELIATPEISGASAMTFTNTKVDDNVEVTLTAKKQFNGKNAAPRSFEFELKGGEDNVSMSATSDSATGEVKFDALSFDASDNGKTYTYTVSEKLPAGVSEASPTKDGITYDTSKYAYTVTVGVNAETGELTATVSPDAAEAPVFQNSSATVTSAEFTAKKELEGDVKNHKPSEFAFSMSKVNSDGSREKVAGPFMADESGTVSFGTQSFTVDDLGKTFHYVIAEDTTGTETVGGKQVKDGVVYDTHEADIYVKVQMDESGKLELTYSSDGTTFGNTVPQAQFKNTVLEEAKTLTGSLTLEGEKIMAGQGVTDGDRAGYSFEVVEHKDGGDQVVARGTSDKDGKIQFGAIQYSTDTEGDVGEHHYYVRESIPTDAEDVDPGLGMAMAKDGAIFSNKLYNVDVKVEKPSEKDATELNVTYSIKDADKLAFTNTKIGKTSATLAAQKQLNGEGGALREFSFNLTDQNGKVIQTKANETESGVVTFDAIEFSAPGTYTYTVSEKLPEGVTAANPTKDGITYDTSEHTYTVTVGVNAETGELTATVSPDAAEAPVFANNSEDVQAVDFTVHKAIEGRDPSGYAFKMYRVDGKNRTEVSSAKSDANGNAVLKNSNGENLKFTAADLDGQAERVFEYVIVEDTSGTTKVGEKQYKGDVAYDTHEEHVYVKLALDAKGKLVLSYSANGVDFTTEAPTFSFTNKVEAVKGFLTLTGKKELKGSGVTADDYSKFEFLLIDRTGNKDEVIRTATANAQGEFKFEPIAYSSGVEGDMGPHSYVIKEVIPEGATDVNGKAYADGFIYDGHSVSLIVTVSKADGKLDVTKTFEGDVEKIAFTNTKVNDEVEVSLVAQKQLNGENGALRQFSFNLTDQNGKVIQTKQNSVADAGDVKAGTVKFDALKFGQSDIGKTYLYTVTEAIPEGAAGVVYDTNFYTYKVTVGVDSDTGKLTATPVPVDFTGVPVFGNTSEDVSADFKAKKSLPGKSDDQKLSDFSFSLFEVVDGKREAKIEHKAADDNGDVNFGSISYTAADLNGATERTFEYVIVEDTANTVKNPEGQSVRNGVAYDTSEKHVFVKLSLTDTGALALAYSEDGEAFKNEMPTPEFVNSLYEASVTKALGSFDKYYYGTALESFEFELRGANAEGELRGVAGETGETIVDRGQDFAIDLKSERFAGGKVKVALPEITYHAAGDYYYLLQEKGTASASNDPAQFLIHVQVTENPDTSLVASDPKVQCRENEKGTFFSSNDVEFFNNANFNFRTFSMAAADRLTASVSVDPTARKMLEGAELLDSQFKFELLNVETGDVVSDGVNMADGEIDFGRIKYTESDADHTYRYKIVEKADGDQQVNFDESAFFMNVEIEKVGDNLSAAVTYEDADGNAVEFPTFQNEMKTARITIQKRSKEPPFDPLEGATYGMWRYVEGGNDIYMGNATSDKDGYLRYEVPLTEGARYYFLEESAPEGHLVDPYPSEMFEFVRQADGTLAPERVE